MLYIDDKLPEIVKARTQHVKAVTCRINKKFYNKICKDKTCKICNSTILVRNPSVTLQKLMALVGKRGILNLILEGKPDKLLKVSNILWKQLVTGFSWTGFADYKVIDRKESGARTVDEKRFHEPYNEAVNAFKAMFEYNSWFNGDKSDRYDAYTMAMNLNRNTCTYCNRIYTHTVKKAKKVARPQFDHWFSKNKHPALSMSFYNLIPSCSVCNSSIKGSLDFDLSTHLHPYVDINCHDRLIYGFKYSNGLNRFEVLVTSTDPNDKRTIDTFGDLQLKDVYDTHHAELEDLLQIKRAYSEKYISNLMTAYPRAGLSYNEVYRLAFGVELDDSEFYKRPLSKFKRDILKELKIVK